MSNNPTTALIVEGGAMRGIFAAGVLDSFMDNSFNPFSFCIGVSAGATNLAAYLANQRGRSHCIITDYSCRKEFINFGNYLRGRHLIDLDWLWQLAYKHYRLDTFAYQHNRSKLFVTTTDIHTGKAHYLQPDAANLEQVLLASCAVPFAYRGYPEVAGIAMTDGGVADSIPVIEAYRRGARDITLILSQPLGYEKQPTSAQWLIRRRLKHLPQLAEALCQRHKTYNATLTFINQPPADCRLRIIAPDNSFDVGRLTRDTGKLNHGYSMGILSGQAYVNDYYNPEDAAIVLPSETTKESNDAIPQQPECRNAGRDRNDAELHT